MNVSQSTVKGIYFQITTINDIQKNENTDFAALPVIHRKGMLEARLCEVLNYKQNLRQQQISCMPCNKQVDDQRETLTKIQ